MFISILTSDRNIIFNDIRFDHRLYYSVRKKLIIVKLIWILYFESINIQQKGSPFLDVIGCHDICSLYFIPIRDLFSTDIAYIIMTGIYLMVLIGPGIY